MMREKNPRIGSSLDCFMDDQGLLEESNIVAVKRVIAWQLRKLMQQESVSKSLMASMMGTSHTQLDCVLDPDNDQVELHTLAAAAKALGRRIKMELV